MAARAIWKGVIAFGGIEVPVKLYSAVQDRGIHFRLIHQKDKVPVSQRMTSSATGEVVPHEEIQKGVEVEPGVFVLVSDEELAATQPEESRTIEIERFVAPERINHQWYERAYYLGPDTGGAMDYWALVQALEKQDKHGVARWTMRKKSYAGCLAVYRGHLVLITMRFAGEVVPAEDLDVPAGRGLDRREVEMASKLIGMLSDEFRPDEYRDTFRERVLELVETKAKGRRPKLKKARRKKAPSSLSTALAASLKAAGKARHARG